MPVRPASKPGRGLELTQPHFVAQTKTFEHECQNATKRTSALHRHMHSISWTSDVSVVKTLCWSLVLMTIFLSVFDLPFLPAL